MFCTRISVAERLTSNLLNQNREALTSHLHKFHEEFQIMVRTQDNPRDINTQLFHPTATASREEAEATSRKTTTQTILVTITVIADVNTEIEDTEIVTWEIIETIEKVHIGTRVIEIMIDIKRIEEDQTLEAPAHLTTTVDATRTNVIETEEDHITENIMKKSMKETRDQDQEVINDHFI